MPAFLNIDIMLLVYSGAYCDLCIRGLVKNSRILGLFSTKCDSCFSFTWIVLCLSVLLHNRSGSIWLLPQEDLKDCFAWCGSQVTNSMADPYVLIIMLSNFFKHCLMSITIRQHILVHLRIWWLRMCSSLCQQLCLCSIEWRFDVWMEMKRGMSM